MESLALADSINQASLESGATAEDDFNEGAVLKNEALMESVAVAEDDSNKRVLLAMIPSENK